MIPRAGNLDRLMRFEEDLDPPGEEDVTVKIKSIGLNFADIFAMFGLYSATPVGTFIPGLEYSGEVLETRSEERRVGKERCWKPAKRSGISIRGTGSWESRGLVVMWIILPSTSTT